jgi:hypothetical protein
VAVSSCNAFNHDGSSLSMVFCVLSIAVMTMPENLPADIQSIQNRIQELIQKLPADQQQKFKPAQTNNSSPKCPNCSTELLHGKCTVQASFWSTVFVGMSYQHLIFQAKDKPRNETRIIKSHQSKHAYYCPSCGLTLIPGKTFDHQKFNEK